MKKIVMLDSGFGGIHILNQCYKICYSCEFVYIADVFNAPYGTKSKKKLKKIAFNMVNKIYLHFKPDVIVFACNTLTVCTIKYIRKKFPTVKFIGVEPAIKVARKMGGNSIIFATKRTIKNYNSLNKKITRQLKNEKVFKKQKVYKVFSENLPTLIDNNIENIEVLTPYIKRLFYDEKYQLCNSIVLGCTHFIALKKIIQNLFPNITVIDSSFSVAKHLQSLLNVKRKTKNRVKILTTNGNKKLEKDLTIYFNELISQDC